MLRSYHRAMLGLTLRALCAVVALPLFGQTTLNGAGATFPYPIYSKWFSEYHQLHPAARIDYQSIGSGGGIRQVVNGSVDFGASDLPMSDDMLKEAKTQILHMPTVMGADVPVYNLPGVPAELKFTPEALAGIFLGRVTKWNDKALTKTNPGVDLPDREIIVVHRADGSGATYLWTDFLSKVSPDWRSQVGVGTSVNWPAGLGGKGNEGVAGLVRQTEGAIGYVEWIYAVQNRIAYGSVGNSAGTFVLASAESVTAAADGTQMPADFRVSLTNAPGENSYPISGFTWLLVPVPSKDSAKGAILADFLNWMLGDGQKMTAELSYAPLPESVIAQEIEAIKQLGVEPLTTAKSGAVPPQCHSMDQAVQIEDAMPSGHGHCAGESDYWFTNTSGQAIDCAIIFHKNGRFDPSSVLNFSLAPGEKSGGTGKISTCGADSGQMQYQCFPHQQSSTANACTAQVQWH
jgi:phosphate transport system substrate-binding protein